LDLFTPGDIIIFFVITGLFIVFRVSDKKSRTVNALKLQAGKIEDKFRELEDRVKAGLGEYIERKKAEITDYGVILETDKRVAKILIEKIDEKKDWLEKNSGELERINSAISGYKGVLEELFRMTERVEENLVHIECESPFVENIAEEVKEAKAGFAALTAKIDEMREAIKNAEKNSLEQLTAGMESFIREQQADFENDFKERAAALERDLSGREAGIERLEAERKAAVERDKEIIDRMLKDAIDNAGERAGKLEDEIYAGFKKQSEEKMRRMESETGEKLGRLENQFEEYEAAQEERRKAVQALLDRARESEAEFKLQLESIEDGIKKEIERFGNEHSAVCRKIAEDCSGQIGQLKAGLGEVRKELETIKSKAVEKTEESLAIFTEEFNATLEKRKLGVNEQFNSWREELDGKLAALAESQEAGCRRIEADFEDKLRRHISELDREFLSETTRLKGISDGLNESLNKQMEFAGESLASLKEQIENDFTQLREETQSKLNSGLTRSFVESSEKLKDFIRDIESRQKDALAKIDEQSGENQALLLKSKAELENSIENLNIRLNEFNNSMEKLKLQSGSELLELEAKIKEGKTAIDNFFEQTKLIETATEKKDALRQEIEDLETQINLLKAEKGEITGIENQLERIKRMELDINGKMTRFAAEQHRLDVIEEEFRRLMQVSQSIEEKLTSLRDSDDLLQELQLKFRKLGAAAAESEEKYQRLEKKNQILEETNEGVDANFRKLQEAEKTVKQFETAVTHITGELENVRAAVEKLSGENSRALETAEKLTDLDIHLNEIERRIGEMQKARQWLADLETRMDNLYREAQNFIKGASRGGGPAPEGGSVTHQIRENVINLKRRGWTNKEIAKNLKISEGTVELILEMAANSK